MDFHRTLAFDSHFVNLLVHNASNEISHKLAIVRAVPCDVNLITSDGNMYDVHYKSTTADDKIVVEGGIYRKTNNDDSTSGRKYGGLSGFKIDIRDGIHFERHINNFDEARAYDIELFNKYYHSLSQEYWKGIDNQTKQDLESKGIKDPRRFLCFKLVQSQNIESPYYLEQDTQPENHCTIYSKSTIKLENYKEFKDKYKTRGLIKGEFGTCITKYKWEPCSFVLKASADPNWKLRRNDDSTLGAVDVYIEIIINALYYLNSNTQFIEEMDITSTLITRVVQNCNSLQDLKKLDDSTRFFLSYVLQSYENRPNEDEELNDEDFAKKQQQLSKLFEEIYFILNDVIDYSILLPKACQYYQIPTSVVQNDFIKDVIFSLYYFEINYDIDADRKIEIENLNKFIINRQTLSENYFLEEMNSKNLEFLKEIMEIFLRNEMIAEIYSKTQTLVKICVREGLLQCSGTI